MRAKLPLKLPRQLQLLAELALDLGWTWSHGGDVFWRRIDAELWDQTGNPWLMLQSLPASRLEALAADAAFRAELRARVGERRAALAAPAWFADAHQGEHVRVAYFSMEFGVDEALPLYAGGLGILAGDHLKTASDLGVSVVGVGILWQHGYFHQLLDNEGRQQELYPHNDPAALPVTPLETPSGDPITVALELPGRLLRLRAWQALIGRVHLYLLDSNHPLNAAVDRGITATLYDSEPETRLLQELILGIGGWRLLQALGAEVDVCHLNEGHAAFVVVERARAFMQDHGVSFREALWATRAGNVFTTHTSVESGFDSFGADLIQKYTAYFDAYVERLGITWPELLALGRRDPADASEPFGMAFLALRGSARINAVSRLHGHVSRRLFQDLFPRWPTHEVPVGHITNGVHVPTWDSAVADELWTAAAGKERWRGDLKGLAEGICECSDEQLWALRKRARIRLVGRARERLRRQLAQRGVTGAELVGADRALDPDALTLGFARRFTAYKRPNLLLTEPRRLRALLTGPARPVQLLIAGKPHPADGEGKRLLADWFRFAADPELQSHVVFIEDYDLAVARELVEGVDVWLNTPRRPWEACGTSGMKVLVNGGLNLSALDGWWAEAYAPENGWALGDGRDDPGPAQDARDAEALYRLLEEEVVPLFYERDDAGIPRRWLQRVRASMADLTPRYSSNRMLREHVERLYLPAAHDFRTRAADGCCVASDLAAWEQRIRAHWHEIAFGDVAVAIPGPGLLSFSVRVGLGGLSPDDVRVELYADPIGAAPPTRQPLALETGSDSQAGLRFHTTLPIDRPAEHFTPRVVPYHPNARLPIELPLIAWQR